MKIYSRFFCLLLSLVLLISAFPLYALAETEPGETTEAPTIPTGTATIQVVSGTKTLSTYSVNVGDQSVTLNDAKYIKVNGRYYQFSYYTVANQKVNSVTIDAFDPSDEAGWKAAYGNTIKAVYVSHSHSYRFGYGRIYHWNICACGHTTNEVRHVDPATDSDKVCTCGYKFNDNADLTTLWLTNMVLSPRFKKEVTEYVGQVRTHLDVTSTKITAKTFDALATVELPENLEIHEGANKFEITVTAEDTVAKKTYTVIAIKPIKVENSFIMPDGTTVSVELKTTIKKLMASAAPSEAVAAKMLELAAEDKSSAISFLTKISKWSTKHVDVTLSGKFLKDMAENTEASLVIPTAYGTTLTVPHEVLAELGEGHEAVTFRVLKDNTFALLADGEEFSAPEAVTLTIPEK